ncbi:MAG: ion transporter [Verrucomicrobiota bacterium]|nr:ion transporter [Verrucomicrobiota bacterium]
MSQLPASDPSLRSTLTRERTALLRRIEHALEVPMMVLGFVWLALLVVELTAGLNHALEMTGTVIWIIFIVDFAAKLALAPRKLTYLKRQWLTALSLLVPALRVLRFARVLRVLRMARAARGLRLLRVLSSLNRGMRALSGAMGRRGFGYAVLLTFVVVFAGAAGMFAFENDNADGRGLNDYPAALWWTAMMITTLGSDYWPQTVEGRVLCLVLALYAFAVFGYVAASLSTYFIERDAESPQAAIVGGKAVEEVRRELAALRMEIRALRKENSESASD